MSLRPASTAPSYKALLKAIAAQLLQARRAQGYSRPEFAALIGVSPTRVWQVETGRSNNSLKVLLQYAEALDARLTITIEVLKWRE